MALRGGGGSWVLPLYIMAQVGRWGEGGLDLLLLFMALGGSWVFPLYIIPLWEGGGVLSLVVVYHGFRGVMGLSVAYLSFRGSWVLPLYIIALCGEILGFGRLISWL